MTSDLEAKLESWMHTVPVSAGALDDLRAVDLPARARRSWLPNLARFAAGGAVLVVVTLVLVVVGLRAPASTGNGSSPRSSLVSGFVDQVDGEFGYRMLRPSNWTPTPGDFPNGRLYLAPGSTNQDQGVVLFAVNLSLPAAKAGFTEVWQAFEQAPTRDGWAAGLAALNRGTTVTLLATLPRATVYGLVFPGSSRVQLAAYIVDQGQALMLLLEANDAQGDLGALRGDGIVDDFVTMSASVTAAASDPANVAPPLPTTGSQAPAPLSYSNGTTIPVDLIVNGTKILTIAPGEAGEVSAAALPGQPWDARVATASGRVLLALTVKAGDVQGDGNSQQGDAVRADLSCGRLDIWSGPPLIGPAPPSPAGSPGDCAP